MNGKSDWQNAHALLLAEGRERLGPPPTFEEVEALYRGTLPEAEAERVRELLVYYPDLARVMSDPFPPETMELDDEAFAEIEQIRERAGEKVAPVVPMRRKRISMPATIAATLVIALGLGGVALMLRSKQDVERMTKVLHADGERGSTTRGASGQTPIELPAATDLLLKPVFRPERTYGDYRLEWRDLRSATPRTVWTRDGVQRQEDGSYPFELSTRDYEPGLYELVLYGVDGGAAPERLATWTMRIYAR